jgi:ABC-type multidrug transport system permease subunit
MRGIAVIAAHDLRLVLGDRTALIWLALMPVVFATFFGLVMGGGGSSPSDARARLTVVDEDGGPVANMLLESLESERLVLVPIAPEDKLTTPDRVRTLVIPAGLSEAVLAGEQTTVVLEKDSGTSAEAALVAQARIVSAIASVLGRLAEASRSVPSETPLSPAALEALPPAEEMVRIDARFAGKATVIPGGFAQSIPGNVVMFVLLVALTFGAASVSGERQGGQLRRLATSPVSRTQIIAGKIAGRFVVAGFQITILMLFGMAASRIWGIPIGDNPVLTWFVLLVYAVAVAPLGVAFGAWFTDPDRAASVGVIATMVMAAFGGCWWPLEVVSRPLQILALAFPTGWAMRAMHGTISFGQTLGGMSIPLLALAGFSLVFTLIAIRSLRFD